MSVVDLDPGPFGRPVEERLRVLVGQADAAVAARGAERRRQYAPWIV